MASDWALEHGPEVPGAVSCAFAAPLPLFPYSLTPVRQILVQ